jgi:hypothetical protein
MWRKRKNTHVAYRDKMGKQSKDYEDHNFPIRAHIWENELSMERY